MALLSAPHIEIRLLGGFELRLEGRRVLDASWPRRKPLLLLKLLALQPRHAIHRERAIEALWPGADPRSGTNNLHQALHLLRRALHGESLVLMRGDQLLLPPETRTDVEAFRAAAADAHAARDIDALERALALYRGDLLPEDAYEDWATAPREELAGARRSLLLALARIHADASEAGRAEAHLRELIALDPLDEAPHLELMRLLERGGALRRAMAQYRSLRAALQTELGVEPSPEANALAEALRERIAAGCDDPPATPLGLRYARSRDGTQIAFIVHPGGPGVPLVHMPVLPWSDLELEWSISAWRAWVLRLARLRPVIRYNLRGMGQSQREVTDISVERQVDDLEAVMDRLAIPTFDTFSGDTVSIVTLKYAARHPGRVRRMVFNYGLADGRAYGEALERTGMRPMMRYDWDTYADLMARAAAGFDEDLATAIAAWLKSTPVDMLNALWDAVTSVDATPCLPSITAPSLLTRRREAFNPDIWALGLKMAAGMPDCRIVEVDGSEFHFIAGDTEPLAAAIDAFLDEDRTPPL